MIDHRGDCNGQPCTCGARSLWEDGAWAVTHPSIGMDVDACNCIHIDGVWMTRHADQCQKHPCTACHMRAGKHIAHMHIEGLSIMADDVQVRTCWQCGKQQYMNREHLWVHVYPAAGCETEAVVATYRPTAHLEDLPPLRIDLDD